MLILFITLKLTEIDVLKKIAAEFTKREMNNDWNINFLQN